MYGQALTLAVSLHGTRLFRQHHQHFQENEVASEAAGLIYKSAFLVVHLKTCICIFCLCFLCWAAAISFWLSF